MTPELLLRWTAFALTTQPTTAADVHFLLDQLLETTRVLYVAAHPDDENTELLAYITHELHYRTAYVSMTRGEGGQNRIGKERGARLGVIRTEELMAARSQDGAEQFFTNRSDFGYSKTAAETLDIWGHHDALRELVFVVRRFRPHIMITRFPEEGPTHGHHLASAKLAREAFHAAADPSCFKQQLTHVDPWSAQRLLHNTSRWIPVDRLKDNGSVDVNVAGYDAHKGLSISEIAAKSRSMHKSQGFGSATSRDPSTESFLVLEQRPSGRRPPKGSILKMKSQWDSTAKRRVRIHLERARATYEPTSPKAAVGHLLKAHAALNDVRDAQLRAQKQRDLVQAIVAAAGLFVDARVDDHRLTAGDQIKARMELVRRLSVPVDFEAVRLHLRGGTAGPWTRAKRPLSLRPTWVTASHHIPKGHPINVGVSDPANLGNPVPPPVLMAEIKLRVMGEHITVYRALRHVWSDRVKGEQFAVAQLLPRITITPDQDVVMLRNTQETRVSFRVRTSKPKTNVKVHFDPPPGVTLSPRTHKLFFADQDAVHRVHLRVQSASPRTSDQHIKVSYTLGDSPRRHANPWSETKLRYPHVRLLSILQPMEQTLVPIELEHDIGPVAYVPGTGDEVAESLIQVGVNVEQISARRIQDTDLNGYSAVILGIRAYNAHPDLRHAHDRLIKYVKQGGVLLVQYNTNSWFGKLEARLGPHPITIGRGRVTDERARVKVLNPKHPLLRSPNRIRPGDFEGWVQERGLYFAKTWSSKYTPLFEIADPGEAPQRGSTLVVNHGKGRFVYTGLSFFRQLPAGVPGAYRLLVNFLQPPRRKP